MPDCPTCDRSFTTRSGLGRHHSLTHGEKLPMRTVPCSNCGTDVGRYPSQIKESDAWFCSTECESEWKTGRGTTEGPFFECEQCGETFEGYHGNPNRYCSYECRSRANAKTGEDNPNWKESVTKSCAICDEEFTHPPSATEYTNRRCCSIDCRDQWVSENLYGPDHPLFQCGADMHRAVRKSLGPRSWGSIARDAKDRAGWECEMCGTPEDDLHQLDTHHIIPLVAGGDHGEYNLMALCPGCHNRAEAYTRQFTRSVLTDG